MKHEFDIKKLIEKFNLGSISREELLYMVSYFKENDPNNELLQVYQEAWEASLSETSEYNFSQAYSNILTNIKADTTRIKQLKKDRNIDFKLIWKYAAVFIIAFSASWFVHNLVKTDRKVQFLNAYQSITVPYGSKSRIELPDGSKVVLNSGSKLKYITGLGDKNRSVFLEGEAFFEVRKDKDHPFYVNVAGLKIKVLGTSFNVKAYPEEKMVETTLVTGKVELFKLDRHEHEKLIATLNPTQKAVYEKENESLSYQNSEPEKQRNQDKSRVSVPHVQIEKNVDTERSTAWKDNKFVFDNERFEDVMKRIERWFNVDIEFEFNEIKEARISGKFDKETVEQAMKALTIATPFHYKIEKNKLTIFK